MAICGARSGEASGQPVGIQAPQAVPLASVWQVKPALDAVMQEDMELAPSIANIFGEKMVVRQIAPTNWADLNRAGSINLFRWTLKG